MRGAGRHLGLVEGARATRRGERGSYTLEWTILLSAVVIAAVLMRTYVRDAIRAGIKSTEIQLNGAMRDNRP